MNVILILCDTLRRDHCGPYHLGRHLSDVTGDRREVNHIPYAGETWLSDRKSDPNELHNLAASHPEQLQAMQGALTRVLKNLNAPPEQKIRLGLAGNQ